MFLYTTIIYNSVTTGVSGSGGTPGCPLIVRSGPPSPALQSVVSSGKTLNPNFQQCVNVHVNGWGYKEMIGSTVSLLVSRSASGRQPLPSMYKILCEWVSVANVVKPLEWLMDQKISKFKFKSIQHLTDHILKSSDPTLHISGTWVYDENRGTWNTTLSQGNQTQLHVFPLLAAVLHRQKIFRSWWLPSLRKPL